MKRIGTRKAKKVLKTICKIWRNGLNSFLRIELDLLGSGDYNPDTAKEHRFGLMEPNMKETGKITKHTAMVFSGMCMVTSMRVNGKEIRPMDLENIRIVTVLRMKGTGVMIYNTDKV